MRLFHLAENGTTVRTEVMAGITTFLTMAYIIFVQPMVMTGVFSGTPTGIDANAVLLATCLSAAGATILMGLFANYPIALAPGMGENFFFVATASAMAGLGFTNAWQAALGVVFVSGVLFLILSCFQIRQTILEAVPPGMRSGMAVGIGLFIAFIGLQHGGLIIAKAGSGVGLNTHLLEQRAYVDVLVFLVGLAVAGGLQARRVRGAILWGIGVSAGVALLFGKIQYQGVFGLPVIQERAVFRMDLVAALSLKALPFIVMFLFMDVFDTLGTLVGVAEQAGFIKDNRIPRANRVFLTDAFGTVLGACLGTSTVTSYIESAAGIAYGGRTGLTSLVTGTLFLVALLFSPLIGTIGNYPPITACALVVVGALMMHNVVKIDWQDFSESFPAFLIAIGIPLTYSIADGLSLGFLAYPVVKLVCGRGKEVSPVMYVLAAIVLAYFMGVRIDLG